MDESDEYHSDSGEEESQLLPPAEERRRPVEEQRPQQQQHHHHQQQQQQKHPSSIAGCGILSLIGTALACSLVLLGKEQYDISSVAPEERGNSTVLERLGTSLSSLRLDVGSPFGRKCQALQYAKLTCPTWDPDSEDGGPGVDYRVRWIDNHQNAKNGNRSCQNSNYLFRAFQHDGIGFGANVYMVVQSSLYIALYSDRIFLFEPEVPFRYGGCAEQNWECYFQPLSRCTTEDAEAIVAANGGEYGEDHLNASHKVLRASKRPIALTPNNPWDWFARRPENPWWVDDFITPGDEELLAGILLYALRPNKRLKEEVEAILGKIFEQHCDFDPARTISLPIRGSDKCQGDMHVEGGFAGESECFPSMERYMAVAEKIRKLDPKVDTIILTSDDPRYLEERHNYTSTGRWRFISNTADTAKGTGTLAHLVKQNHTLDEIFISFITTMHLQLKGKYYILNTGSNFHRLIKDMAEHGRCTPSVSPAFFSLDAQFAEDKLCHQDLPGGMEACLGAKKLEIERKHGHDSPPSDLRRSLASIVENGLLRRMERRRL